jgi:tRNA pseudouridine55 synthase
MKRRGNRRSNKNHRKIDGILLLDKPVGLTSNAALQEVKHLFNAKKAGHTGSLDPLATGMLPICLGEATKVSGFLLDADKRYRMTCKLGEKTATADAEGEVIETRDVPELDTAIVEDALNQFMGEIEQIPPMYSALKHNGERLYVLARQGKEVERKPRAVVIHELKLLSMDPSHLELEIKCSKGTYVRTLAEDIAEALGTVAHVIVLRRLEVGPFSDAEQMVTLDELKEMAVSGMEQLDARLFPIESALLGWPDVQISSDDAFYVRQGQAVQVPHAPTSGWVRIYEDREQFLGMGQIQEDGKVAPKRLFCV